MKKIAHRGASGYAPENTKASILKGLEFNVDGFEVDVQLTKDNNIVVFHDWTLDRTSTGNGFIKNHTLENLKKLDIGSWYHEEFYDEKILTLDELLEIVPKDKILNIEIKIRHGEVNNIESKVIEILNKHKRVDENIIISSFDHKVIENIKAIEPKLQVGLLITAGLIDIKNYTKNFDIYSVHSRGEFISKNNVEEMKSLGIKTFAWTVNTVEEVKIMENFGVEGVITNYPDIF